MFRTVRYVRFSRNRVVALCVAAWLACTYTVPPPYGTVIAGKKKLTFLSRICQSQRKNICILYLILNYFIVLHRQKEQHRLTDADALLFHDWRILDCHSCQTCHSLCASTFFPCLCAQEFPKKKVAIPILYFPPSPPVF